MKTGYQKCNTVGCSMQATHIINGIPVCRAHRTKIRDGDTIIEIDIRKIAVQQLETVVRPDRECNVWRCRNQAKYYNPRSGYKYCQEHHDQLKGKIIYDGKSKPQDIERLRKLRKVTA